MTNIVFDYPTFQLQIPQYSNPDIYPEQMISNFWMIGSNYMQTEVGFVLNAAGRTLGLNLFAAHLIYLQGLIQAGQVPGMVTGATVDKVNVTLTPPPLPNQFQWWMGLTPYGQQWLALMTINMVGGLYVGGAPQRAAFGYQGAGW